MKFRITHSPLRSMVFATILIGIVGFAGWQITKDTSHAADIKNFDPGNIMSDAVMSNKDTMSVQAIQNFLNSKNYCDNKDTYKAAWYPHLQYNIKDGRFVCMARDSFNGKSAAQIIWQVGQDYNINPQFLIVLLEKEQGLVSDTWPNHVQYRTATGYGCPDTAPCDSQYFGLENQLRQAANLFRNVLNGGWSNYPVGQTYVQYHPNAACGGSVINIQNRATSALYRYTPYQPNQSALSAGYGTGDSCGAYGNRNTWRLFTDWFGSTNEIRYVSLDDPRWMEVKTSTQKLDVNTGERFGPIITPGSQARFVDKVFVNGRWIARTEWDRNNGNLAGFPDNELSEIKYQDIEDTWMVISTDTHKIDFLRGSNKEFTQSRSLARFVDKITVGGKEYYRTEYEKSLNRSRGYPVDKLTSYNLFDFENPRIMVTNKDTLKIDALTKAQSVTIPKNTMFYMNKLLIINGVIYAQTAQDNGTNIMIDSRNLSEVPDNPFHAFKDPRVMQINSTTQKVQVESGAKLGVVFPTGTQLDFVDQIKVNGSWYARTKDDHNSGRMAGFLVPELSEVSPVAITRIQTTLKNNSYKIDPVRGTKFESLTAGSSAQFIDKITIHGTEYYRTAWEHDQNRPRFIPAADIKF